MVAEALTIENIAVCWSIKEVLQKVKKNYFCSPYQHVKLVTSLNTGIK
jgi:hypothetical protein